MGAAAVAGVAADADPAPPAELAAVSTQIKLVDTESWIMGGSGTPIPPQSYLDAVSQRYIDPATPFFAGQPTFDDVTKANGLFTPEGLYPFTAVKNLELDPSAAQGVQILDATIHQQIAAGNDVVVLGYSQSATISSLEMQNLLAGPEADQPTADQLKFVLLGDPSNPDGGLLSRFDFPGLNTPTIPSLGVTFSGATPADTPWETAIYTQEYDGFADFPKYPINLLADINALAGILTVHGKYPSLTDAQLESAIQVLPADGYTGDTTYWMIPTEQLPLTQLIGQIPVLGQPLADLIEPDLRVLVNLGYGPDPDVGWSTTGANLATPFGLFPQLDSAQFGEVLQAFGAGAEQGVGDFVDDLSHLSLVTAPAGLATPGALDLPSLTDVVNAVSGAASSAYSALLPTADIVNALLTTAPVYAVDIITQELGDGDLLDAIGLPIAGLLGLGSFAVGLELIAVANAVSGVSDGFSGLF